MTERSRASAGNGKDENGKKDKTREERDASAEAVEDEEQTGGPRREGDE